jgi:uncharacterized membrane protein
MSVFAQARSSAMLHLCIVFALFVCGFFISLIVSPVQSPDEDTHITRAYLLSQGHIKLDQEAGIFGGRVDSGLVDYLGLYFKELTVKKGGKLSAEQDTIGRSITWSGHQVFASANGTAPYFPLLYAPQALALAAGEALNLTLDSSYRLARLASLIAACLIFWLAFSIYSPPPAVIALLLLPMSIFQLSAASLDAVAHSVALLAISCFLKVTRDGKNSEPWLLYLLSLSVFAVTNCRGQLLPLLILLFAGYGYTRDKKYLISGFALVILVGLWMIISVQGGSMSTRAGVPTGQVIGFYLSDPLTLIKVLARTITEPSLLRFYAESFLGILGWLDSPFSSRVYLVLFVLLILVVLSSVSWKILPADRSTSLVLAVGAIGSIALTFLALLFTWTPHPAHLVDGVQGRYFLVPAIMLAYAVSPRLHAGWRAYLSAAALVVLGLFSVAATSKLLLARYYIAESLLPISDYAIKPSAPLSQGMTYKLLLSKAQTTQPRALHSLGIMFGTYQRRNTGSAVLRLRTPQGKQLDLPFEFEALKDNRYKTFDLDGQRYNHADIIVSTGGGVALWEAHTPDGASIYSCLAYGIGGGSVQRTHGCPRP